MGKLGEPRVEIVVESYIPEKKSGHHGEVHVRLVEGQGYDPGLPVRCNRDLVRKHPVGTRFLIVAMLTDHLDGQQYFSSHHSWKYKVISQPEA